MAILASRPTVTPAVGLIASNTSPSPGEGDYRSRTVTLKNVTATATVYLGPAGVTSATGFAWDAIDGPMDWTLEPGESLYGILATGGATQTIHVLQGGR